MRFLVASVIMLCVFTPPLFSAPVDLKELDFLVRQATPDAEILEQVALRRLAAPLDAAGEAKLKANGASDDLIAKLKNPPKAPADETHKEIERLKQYQRLTPQAAQEAAREADRIRKIGTVAAPVKPANYMRKLLDGKLVAWNGGLKTYDAANLDKVRIYAFYYSASWCGPCRKFTPKLVAAYKEWKARYPEVEVIFVSADNDEFNMGEYMKRSKMPWPAVKYDKRDDELKKWGGRGIPWLVAVDAAGQPLTENGRTKDYEAPESIIRQIDGLLANLRAAR